MYFVGLDIGTSGTKAVCMDETGNLKKIWYVSYGFEGMARGWRELDPEAVWRAVLNCLQTVSRECEVETITVSSLGESVIAVDKDGMCLTKGITGTDVRGREEGRRFIQETGNRTITEITGLPADCLYSLSKILWMKGQLPRLLDKTWKIFSFQDFIIYRLCGEAVIDYSIASRTMLFDYRTCNWSEYLFTQAGLSDSLVSKPVQAWYIAGCIRQEIRRKLGCGGKCLVVAGCHDHIANAIGAGVCRAGECVNAAGTTEGLTVMMRPGVLTESGIERYNISCEPSAVKGLYNSVAWSNASGSILRWFVRDVLKERQNTCFRELNSSIQYEPTQLYVLPHFSGAATPYMDDGSRGAILGLTLDARREDLYQAIVEGIQMELCGIYKCLHKAGIPITRIVSTGGALSNEILQMKADILGCEIHSVECGQTGAAGGAILGAVSDGIYDTVDAAVKAMVRTQGMAVPDMKRHEAYEDKMRIYDTLYAHLRDINHSMDKAVFPDSRYFTAGMK
mgnify:CR=1 FL=1